MTARAGLVSVRLVVAICALPSTAVAQVAASWVLPSSVYRIGANDAEFHTDVRLLNQGNAPLLVTASFYDQVTGLTFPAAPIPIAGRSQVAFDNILDSLFGRTLAQGSFGPIRFQAAGPLVVSSSVNNVKACGGTAISGQWLPGLDATQAMTAGTIGQLAVSATSSTGYRTNVVFVNPGAQTATVSARVRRGDGSLLSLGTIDPLAPNGFIQVALDSSRYFPEVGGTTGTDLWLEFRSDQPVLAFASVINNASGDPFAVVATADPGQSAPPAHRPWTSVGPYGGSVYSFAFDPTRSTTVFAGTEGAGVFKSTDSGDSWAPANAGLPGYTVTAIAVDAKVPSVLYAGTFGGGVFRSTDSGGSWAGTSTGLDNLAVYALAVDPAVPSTLYAGTENAYGGVFKSTDSGRTWVLTNNGLPVNPPVLSLAIDPSVPATLYAGVYMKGVFKSTDAGATWTAASAGLERPGWWPASAYSLAVDPAAPSTVYAGTGTWGVFRTTDGGASWAVTKLDSATVPALAVNPSTPGSLYAGTDQGVFRSTDSGGTWAAATAGLPGYPRTVWALAVTPTSTPNLLAGTDVSGIFKSTDSGRTWSAASNGLTNVTVNALATDPTRPSILYAATDDGVSRSTDSGRSWAAASLRMPGVPGQLPVYSLAIDPSAPSTLYAATEYGFVIKSVDSGGTWVKAGDFPGNTIWALAVDPGNPANVYAGAGYGIVKSTDSGASWAAVNAGLPQTFSVGALAIDPGAPGTLYAGSVGGEGVFKSTDSGGTWATANTGLPGSLPNVPYPKVWALAISPVAPSTLHAATTRGVFRSTDSGTTWAAANQGLATSAVSFAVDPTTPSTLYAATYGVFKTTDSGGTWSGNGLTGYAVLSLAIGPAGDPTLYAGTYANSVWRQLGVGAARDLAAFDVQGDAVLELRGDRQGDVEDLLSESAATSVNDWVLPSAVYRTGTNGAEFHSDVRLLNQGNGAVSVIASFYDQVTGRTHPTAFPIAARSQVSFDNVLHSLFGRTLEDGSFGPVRFQAAASLVISSVVNNVNACGTGATSGQWLPGIDTAHAVTAGTIGHLAVSADPAGGYRSNVVFMNPGAQATTVNARVRRGDGSLLSSGKVALASNGFDQVALDSPSGFPGVGGTTDTNLWLEFTSDQPVLAFASVINNASGDPFAVVATPEPAARAPAARAFAGVASPVPAPRRQASATRHLETADPGPEATSPWSAGAFADRRREGLDGASRYPREGLRERSEQAGRR